ncbi:MAG: glycosyltransferase family 4 protein [Syntrophomonas sp.]
MDKKLIALLTNHDDDIYCFRKELIEVLVANNYEVLISCPYGSKLELMNDIPYIHDNIYIDRRGTNVLSDVKLLLHYVKILKQYEPDIVLGYTAKPNVYGSMAAKWLKIPYINNVTGLGSALNKNSLLKSLIMFLFKRAFKHSNYIFFQNDENMNLAINRGMVRGKYRLIPGSGVNTERFPLQPYPEDNDKIIFNYIGRVLYDKGVDDYIEAAKRIKKKHPNTEFNIIGFIEPSENHYNWYLKKLEYLGILNYRGNQNDVRPFIARSHATIHPSNYGEGMSNVLLESASSGRPVITTNIAGCREIVDDGVSGFIYNAGDIDELVLKIETFIGLDNVVRKNMGIAGRNKVCKTFSRSIVVDAYLKAIGCLAR